MHSGGRWVSIADLRAQAKRRLPRPIFDYIDGGAEDEITLRHNREQFAGYQFCHRVGVDVSRRDQSVTLFGERFASPFVVGPTGLAALAWPKADLALAEAASAAGIPLGCSMVGSVALEEIASATRGAKWFQLYIFRDRALSDALLERARRAGYGALIVTMDCPVGGKRERDFRNGFTIPLRPSLSGAIDLVRRPGWCLQMLGRPVPRPENFASADRASLGSEGLVAFMTSQLDPSVTWEDVRAVRAKWKGPLIVKGILSLEDAKKAAEIGADAVVLSNHGGRQLDGATSSLAQLPRVADALGGRLTIFVDSGFRRGGDIVKACALGADAVFLGRPLLYGAAAAGAAGARAAAEILRDEIDRTLALIGCPAVEELDRSFIHANHAPLVTVAPISHSGNEIGPREPAASHRDKVIVG